MVVGGGPAGLLAGAAAAEMGARVKVLEEDGEVGEPDHCAGVVSSRGVRALVGGRGAVINEIRGARIFSPTGRCYTVRAGDVKAYVVDRPRFDREMRRMAEGAGAEVETGVRYAKGMECKVLVVAEGTRAMIPTRLGFEVPVHTRRLTDAGARADGRVPCQQAASGFSHGSSRGGASGGASTRGSSSCSGGSCKGRGHSRPSGARSWKADLRKIVVAGREGGEERGGRREGGFVKPTGG